MADQLERCDILILGAGPVGTALALALADGPYRVRLAGRQPQLATAGDPRALALSYGTRQLLAGLDAWPERLATPIETIHVSQRGGFGRTLIDAKDYGIEALGYVVRYGDLAETLAQRLPPGCRLEGSEIAGLTPTANGLCARLVQDGVSVAVEASIVVHAEGTSSDDAESKVRDYHQHAIIAEVRSHPGHGRRAWERFTPDGPLALLPLGDGYSVVLTLPPEQADRSMALDDRDFLAALQARIGNRLAFTATGPRSRFPLALRLRERLVSGREVWIGNAAQTLHPVSGQGLNLGLRDAWQLAECLLDHGTAPASLEIYDRSRRLDRQGGAWFTDSLVRIFSNHSASLKIARGLGLLALDLIPPARRFLAGRMIWGARAWP